MSDIKAKKLNWGWGIVGLNAVFVIFIISLVIIANTNDFELVESNYYEKEVNYQDKIDKINNANQLEQKPVWSVNPNEKILILKFAEEQASTEVQGSLHLFRPSDADDDNYYKIELDRSGLMMIKIDNYDPGLWKLKIDWRSSDVGYYIEDVLILE